MFDAVAIGELLIDFTPITESEKGTLLYQRNPGGAPANVLAALAKLGKKTSFIGKVGNDKFGRFLFNVLRENSIDTSGIVFSDNVNTTLAFVHLDDKGERSFSFYRNLGADMMLTEDEVDLSLIDKTTVFHFGSISMTHEPVRSATLKALKYASEQGKFISFDPNLRSSLWESLETAKEIIQTGIKFANLLKLSEEELEFLTGTSDLDESTGSLLAQSPVQLILVTLGSKGCYYRTRNYSGMVEGFSVNTIDTTGAGDAFLGGMLYQILERGKKLSDITETDLTKMLRFANAMGALTTTKKGAISALPDLTEVLALLGSR